MIKDKSKSHNKTIGNIGETITCTFLERKGFRILERNYLKKWGEIDIVALKDKTLNFIEVKSVVNDQSQRFMASSQAEIFRPEENVHILKQRRLRRTIQTYLAERGYGSNATFVFHVAVVRMDPISRRARVNLLENIIL